jgi:hypothetical protein
MAQSLTFAYKALDAQGARRNGVVEAESRDAAVARLSAEGRFVTEIREHSGSATSSGGTARRRAQGGNRRARRSLSLLVVLLTFRWQGLPLDRVLQVVAEQSESPVLRGSRRRGADRCPLRNARSVRLSRVIRAISRRVYYADTPRGRGERAVRGKSRGKLADFQEKK